MKCLLRPLPLLAPSLLAPSLLALPLVSSCNDGGGKDDAAATDTTLDTKTDTTADTTGTTGKTDTTDTATTPTKPATPSGGYDLSGTWGWTKTGFYKLKQTGASLQGTYYDPGIPGARGAIAGTVSGLGSHEASLML